jgi:indole-3-glycerol phosphate synthase
MSDLLKTILDHKRSEVKALAKRASSLHGRTQVRRDFRRALLDAQNLAVIAEAKKASPSKGLIVEDFDPVAIAKRFQTGGATAISVLTDERFFQGRSGYLTAIREKIRLPVLRKDFIIDLLQVRETAGLNADAMLLIAAALSAAQLEELYSAAIEMDLEPLIEIHDGRDLDRVMRLEPALIGINNRDLRTFSIDTAATLDLMPHIPKEVTVVSESGIFSASDTTPLMAAGVRAVLVGEALMRSDDPTALIRSLRHLPQEG